MLRDATPFFSGLHAPSDRPRRFRIPILQGVIGIAIGIVTVGCDQTGSNGVAPAETETATSEAPPSGERRGYEIPIPQIEYWDPERSALKYTYEMRFDAPGADGRARLHRNGWARAYFGNGSLEREGSYQWIPQRERSERVGRWTYYKADGTVDRIEQRGGDSVWSGPDQRIPPPGTEPK
ncbi:MAG: hypothetical protein CMJ23_02485 [Phycisphaerae bacterium]|nr:hypothetical protein [Phycisphaerae bacterium]